MPDPAALPVVDSKTVYRGRAVSLRVDTVLKADGARTTREIVEHADCVVVAALDESGQVFLVRQHRPATGKTLLELPAGGIEPGETPEDAVRRELQEEVGRLPRNVRKLGGFYSAPGYCTEYLHLYLATDLEPRQLHASDTDEIEVVRVKLDEAKRLIFAGEIEDSKSIAGLLTVLAFPDESA